MASRFRDLNHFRTEILRGRSGPMASPCEDIADELYHQEFTEEFDSMWDSQDSESEDE